MFNKEQNESTLVNANIDMTFSAIINGVSTLSGFTIKQVDQQNYVIYISKGLSLFTWGENIVITLGVDPNSGQTIVNFSSDSKLGTEFAAKSQNRKNINEIIGAMNKNLIQQKIIMSQQMATNPQMQVQPPINNSQVQQPMEQAQIYQQQTETQAQPTVVEEKPQEEQKIASTQHTDDALSNNLNNM